MGPAEEAISEHAQLVNNFSLPIKWSLINKETNTIRAFIDVISAWGTPSTTRSVKRLLYERSGTKQIVP